MAETHQNTDLPLRVESGACIVHRLFDVADSIDLALAEELWLAAAGQPTRRTHLSRASANELAYEVPPTLLVLPKLEIEVDGVALQATATARLYDFGVIALALRFDASDLTWDAFAAHCNQLDRATGGRQESALWQATLRGVLDVIAKALNKPSAQHLEEDYLFAVVHRFSEPMTGVQVRSRVDVAQWLSGEPGALSRQEQAELTRQSYSYLVDDLVVLTWDRAFILEPRGESDVIDVIEVANAQLLEMRYYDELLDDELSTMYELVENARGGLSLVASRRAVRLARRLYGLVAEVTRLTERVDNSLQVTEDVYLARVYGAALDLFRVPKLGAAVDRKLAIIRDTYGALYEEASSRRAELLELAIVLLIVFEIALALAKW
jgi:hypothetical protein